jgi:hypothetical protein
MVLATAALIWLVPPASFASHVRQAAELAGNVEITGTTGEVDLSHMLSSSTAAADAPKEFNVDAIDP